jgi:hypothetical protein
MDLRLSFIVNLKCTNLIFMGFLGGTFVTSKWVDKSEI